MEKNQFSTCLICDKKVEVLCSGCGKALYCSKHHLKENSVMHKMNCHPYSVSKNDLLGRFLVAARDIRQGEIVFQEKPLVFGPAENSFSPICFSCGGIPNSHCKSCQVALTCGPECLGKGHSNTECETYKCTSTKLKSTSFITNNLILPIRCILSLRNPQGGWANFFNLESHTDKRRGTPIRKLHHQNIVQVLQKWGVITKTNEDEELIQEIMGVLDVNTFEVRCGINSQGRALYLEAALMAHDCFPNCLIAVDNNFVMTVKARRDIPAGHSITHNYTNTLHGTMTRREHLLETKYFICNCNRCSDPTELGTHLSSILCTRCHQGLVVFKRDQNHWICNQCNHQFSNGLIMATLIHVKNLIDDLDKNSIKEVENMIKRLSKSFAPNHSFIIDLKQQLAVLYRDTKPNLEILIKRRQLCEDLLAVIGALEPGISRLQGIALYELHVVLLGLAQLKQNDLLLLQEAEKLLKESISQVLHEPPNSPEGGLSRQAMSELKNLRDIIQVATKKKNKKKTKS